MRICQILLSLCLLVTVGCGGSPPEAEIGAAEAALQSAQTAGADVYSKEGFDEATQALEAARREIAAQQEKFSFNQDYSEALRLLETAKSEAEEAAAGVADAKQQVRNQAESAAQEAEQALEEATQALRRAPRGKGTRADIAALTQDLENAKSTQQQAQSELANDDLLSALAHFQQAKSQAESVTSNIPRRR